MKLQPVRGTHDLMGEALDRHNWIIATARQLARCYGCDEIATPIFEFSQVFKRTLGEQSDIVNKEMYTFEDRGGESITLRPEGTAPIARSFVSEGLAGQTPLKLFYQGPMFRYERPQKGRQRQFHQLGVEYLGLPQPTADAECLSFAHNLLCQLGLESMVTLEVNSIGDEESRTRYRSELVAYLTKHQEQLSEDSKKRLSTNPLRILDSKDEKDAIIVQNAPVLESFLNESSAEFYKTFLKTLDLMEIPYEKNPRLVRGLDYYCHVVFEFKTTHLGSQDAVLSGGRYDQLISQMGGPATPGVGFAAGIERLAMLSTMPLKKQKPVSLIPLGEEAENWAQKFSHTLRAQYIAVDLSHSGNLSKRMKRADKAGSHVAIIVGSDELARGEVTWKNLETGDQKQVPLSSLLSTLQLMKSGD
jgi:histidyl-tRNA synthetase